MNVQEISVLVAMDMSPMDEALIQFIGVATKIYPLARFTFLHNIKLNELPEEYKTHEKIEEIRTNIRQRIEDMIAEAGTVPVGHSVEVTSHDFTERAFLTVSKRIDAHLAIVGNKQELTGGGGMARKLIRMWQIATLMVPETFNRNPQKIITAVDFSKYTPTVNRVAKRIVSYNKFGISQINPIYVSKVAWQFFPGPSPAEIKQIIEDDTRAKKRRWKREYPQEEELTVLPSKEKSIARVLGEYVNENDVDLVIMGVLGASSLTGLFLGSVSNELINQESNACILLVKRVAP